MTITSGRYTGHQGTIEANVHQRRRGDRVTITKGKDGGVKRIPEDGELPGRAGQRTSLHADGETLVTVRADQAEVRP